jgi:hypothetical protein
MTDARHSQARPGAAHSGDIMKMFEGPTEASLDEAQLAIVSAARTAFRELEKLIKNTALYGTAHESTGRFRIRFFESISRCFEQADELEISLAPYVFSLFGQSIYENPSPEKNFIYKFYVDGIRRIFLRRGLKASELDDFVDVLLVNWSDPTLFEDDAVTVLWGKDFDHIEYVVVQAFDQDTQEHEEHHFTIAGVVEEVRRAGQAAQSSASRAARKGRPPVSPVIALTEDNLGRLGLTDFAMDEVEFNTLRGLLGANARETLEKFIEILFKVRLNEDDEAQIQRIEQLFDRIAGLLISRGRIGDLERLLRKVLRLRGPHGIDLPANVDVIGRIFARWTQSEFIDQILATLDDPESPYLPSVQALCALLVPAGATTITRRVGRILNPEHRAALFAQLPALIRGQASAVAHLLTDADPAHAHAILAAIHAQRDPDAFRVAVRCAMESPEAGVRFEALAMLQPQDVGGLFEPLFAALEDDAKKVRSKALHLLARVRNVTVHERFMAAIDQKGFEHFDLDEKRRYFVAAALSGDANAYLLEKLTAHSGLLARKHHDEERHCAAVALAIRMSKEALPVFQGEVRRRIRNEVVYTACRWALQHVQRDRETRTRQLYDIFYLSELTGIEGHHG